MKTKLNLLPINRGAFNCAPAREVEVESERVLCNNVILPWEFNPHAVRLWAISNELGVLGVVWASHEQEALDVLVDENLGDSLIIAEEDRTEDDAHAGNAGEPVNLDNVWIQQVDLNPEKNCRLLCDFARAEGAGETNLEK